MKRFLAATLLLCSGVTLFGAARDYTVVAPMLPLTVRMQISNSSFFSPVDGGFEVSPEQLQYIDKAVLWSWMSIGAFGANTLGLIVSLTADPVVGGVLSLLSVGFWTASNMLTAFSHRDLTNDMDFANSDAPRPTTAGLAALVAGAFGSGALSAISLSFSDATGTAEAFAYVCIAISSIAGGYGIYKTFEYAEAAGLNIDFF